MEKLQAALEKARGRREAGSAAVKGTRPRSNASKASPKVALWENLQEVNLSDNTLKYHHVVSQKASKQTTPFDVMRTKILLQMRQNGWKSIAVTSPMPKSGKTTLACNLALGLGRQGGLHTILFDMDLQSPSVSEFLGHTPEKNITDMLSGQVSFADQAIRVDGNVAVSMANRSETDPTRTLLARKTEETLEAIEGAYTPDIMIYDTPSILVNDNTRSFLRNVDCAVIVARAGSTRYGHFDACEREIAEYTNVLGVVLNAFRTKDAMSYMD